MAGATALMREGPMAFGCHRTSDLRVPFSLNHLRLHTKPQGQAMTLRESFCKESSKGFVGFALPVAAPMISFKSLGLELVLC
jgi:hypothetical protein